nr:Maf family protein [uncultured Lichenicoccus sp.]
MQTAGSCLVLASGSAIRSALLRSAGIAAEVVAPRIDEGEIKHRARTEHRTPEGTALLLAAAKARQVAVSRPDALVIGADQLLVIEQRWFDKPVDLDKARLQLLALRGRTHVLHTAVCVQRNDRLVWSHIAQPALTMRTFSDATLDAYLFLEGDQVLASVGAYRLEGPGIHLFDRIVGEHAAILGLPMLALLACLRDQGVLLA